MARGSRRPDPAPDGTAQENADPMSFGDGEWGGDGVSGAE